MNLHPAAYAVQVEGHFDHRYTSWFEGKDLSSSFSGETPTMLLSGTLSDQSALHGPFDNLQAMSLLVSLNVNRLEPPTLVLDHRPGSSAPYLARKSIGQSSRSFESLSRRQAQMKVGAPDHPNGW